MTYFWIFLAFILAAFSLLEMRRRRPQIVDEEKIKSLLANEENHTLIKKIVHADEKVPHIIRILRIKFDLNIATAKRLYDIVVRE